MQTVRAAGLIKAFGSVVAVNNLSFEAKAALMMTVIGLAVVVLVRRLVQGNVRTTTVA